MPMDIVVVIVALILLLPLMKWSADREDRAQRVRDMALHKSLLADACALDDVWQQACDTDTEAAVARIRGGDLSARLGDWEIVLGPRCPGDAMHPAPWASSVVELRNRRRREVRSNALDRLEQERQAYTERQRQAEWEKAWAREAAQRLAAEREAAALRALRDRDPAGYFYKWLRS